MAGASLLPAASPPPPSSSSSPLLFVVIVVLMCMLTLNRHSSLPPSLLLPHAGEIVRHVQQANSALYFQYNTQLGPPYQILVDTNFINFSIQNKLELNKVRVYSLLIPLSYSFPLLE